MKIWQYTLLNAEMKAMLKQGDKVSFRLLNSDLFFQGRIEMLDNVHHFISEHNFEGDTLKFEQMKYANKLSNFGHFKHFKLL